MPAIAITVSKISRRKNKRNKGNVKAITDGMYRPEIAYYRPPDSHITRTITGEESSEISIKKK